MIDLATLPKPPAASSGLLNLLNSIQGSFALPVYPDLEDSPEQHTMFLSVRPVHRPGQSFHSAHMHCDLGDATVFATPEWLEHLCDLLLSGWRDETRDALSWDVCVAYVLSRLTKLSGFDVGRLSFGDVKVDVDIPDGPETSVLNANVRSGDQVYPIAMQVHNCDPNQAAVRVGAVDFDGARTPSVALVDPGFVYKMACRTRLFDMHMLRQVKIGSIITFDRVEAGGCKVVCTVPDIVSFEAVFNPSNQLTFNNIIEEGRFMISEMSQDNLAPTGDFDETLTHDQMGPEQPQQADGFVADSEAITAHQIDEMSRTKDIERLPVSVEFCFPSQRMTLRELTNLGSGSSFTLDCALEERLIVRVNGQPVGGGHLVDLNGILGLKVSDWSLDPAVHEDTREHELD